MAAITHRLRCEILEARRLATSDILDSLGVSFESFGVEGLRAAEIRVKYDPRALDISAAEIRPGDIWQGQASLISNVDEKAGSVSIFLFSTEPIEKNRGNLVDLQFAATDAAIVDVSSATVSEVRLNEGAIEVSGQLKPIAASSAEPVAEIKACSPWSVE